MTVVPSPVPNPRVLVVSDNEPLLTFFTDLLTRRPDLQEGRRFRFVCSPASVMLAGRRFGDFEIETLSMKRDLQFVIDNYDLVVSAHCKQLFPAALVGARLCVNIHPGLNPHNRGWYPQVFSIVNGLPLGATIHVIDEELDHGGIIDQLEVPVHAWDTSLDAYLRVLAAEEVILERSIGPILAGRFETNPPPGEGNLNLKKDFERLCAIDLAEPTTFGGAIDRLRALSHGPLRNASFLDPKSGRRVFVRITLEPEEDASE